MCVILHGLKKKHMRRAEVVQGMKSNNSGFFIAVIDHEANSRKTLRTLEENELLKVFDAARDDDEIVVHARIPSRGEKTLANVHGWESDGIVFCHNMTLTSLDDMMKRADWKLTDSEFFFRKIFIPYYRGLGKDAYRDGKLHDDLDNLVRHFVGTSNKFCFIMPDNRVLRYGTWVNEKDRKEGGEIAFWASNSTYVVHEKPSGWKPSAPYSAAYDDDYDDYDLYHTYRGCSSGAGTTGAVKMMGKALLSGVGAGRILRMAVLDMCVQNIVQTKELSYIGKPGRSAFFNPFEAALPDAFTKATMAAVLDGLAMCTDDEGVDALAEEYADAVSETLAKTSYGYYVPSASDVVARWDTLVKEVTSFATTFSVGLNPDAVDIRRFICAVDVPYRDRKGKWVTPVMDYSDLIGDGSMKYSECAKRVNRVLRRAAELVRAEESAGRKDTPEGGGTK